MSSKDYTTLRPWYGTWPPKLRKEHPMKKRIASQWESQRATVVLFVVFLLGVIALLWSYELPEVKPGGQLLRDIGIAFVIASLLGISIDQILRRQLIADAFKASVGYLLPDELRGELEWIYNTHILCVEHSQVCELRMIGDDTCAIYVNMLRKLRNISSSNQPLQIGGAIDEWFYNTGTSGIISLGYTKLGTRTEINERIKKEGGVVAVKEQAVSLAPGEEITVWFESQEIKRRNDEQYWMFAYPTLNPTVAVKAFESESITVSFGYRSSAEELGIGTYRLKGTLLPSQGIKIRWWDKDQSEQWMKT